MNSNFWNSSRLNLLRYLSGSIINSRSIPIIGKFFGLLIFRISASNNLQVLFPKINFREHLRPSEVGSQRTNFKLNRNSSFIHSRYFYLSGEQSFDSLGFHARIFSFVSDSGTVDWSPSIQNSVSTNSYEGPFFKGIDIEHLEGWLKVTPPESCRQNFRKNSEFDLSKKPSFTGFKLFCHFIRENEAGQLFLR